MWCYRTNCRLKEPFTPNQNHLMNKLILSLAVLPWLCGCAGLQRPIGAAALGAGGAYLGNKLSDGNALATAGGAAGGVLLSEGFQAWKSSGAKKAYTEGFTHGRSDGVKSLYWNLQDQQRRQAAAESFRLYDVTIPEHWEEGVLVKPTQRVLRIQE